MSNFVLDGDFRFSNNVTFNPIASAAVGSYWTSAGANPGGARGTYNGQTWSSKAWLAQGPAIPDPAIQGVLSVGLIGAVDGPAGNYGAIVSTKIPNGNRIFSGSILRISFWLYTNSRHIGIRLHRNFGTSSTTAEQVIDIRAGQDLPVGTWEHVSRDFVIPAAKSTDDFRPDDFITLDFVLDNIGASLPFLNIAVPFAESTSAAVPLIAITGLNADFATSQTPAVPSFYSPAAVSDAGQLTGAVGGSGFTIAGTGLTSTGGGTTINLVTPVTAALGGTGVTTIAAEVARVAIMPLATNALTVNGVPGTNPTETPSFARQLGQSPNSGILWQANSTAAGDWSGFQFTPVGGIVQVGDPMKSGAQAAFGDIYWYLAGSPNRQNVAQAAANNGIILVNCNPYGSGPAYNLAYIGKTNSGSLLSVNTSAENIYMHDPYAGSFLLTPENGPAADNPGVVTVLSNGARPMAISTTFGPTGTVSNYPWYFVDPRTSPYKSYFSKFVDTKLDPTTGGWLNTMVIDHTNGTVGLFGKCTNTANFVATGSGRLSTGGPIAFDAGGTGGNTNSGMNYETAGGIAALTFGALGNPAISCARGIDGWFGSAISPIVAIGADIATGTNWGNSTFEVHGSTGTDVKTKVANYTLTIDDSVILLNAATLTATLPDATFHCKGRKYTIKLIAAATTGTVATTSAQNIDGATTFSLSAQYKYVRVQSNGTQWYIIANN